jgi:hypothetical protein
MGKTIIGLESILIGMFSCSRPGRITYGNRLLDQKWNLLVWNRGGRNYVDKES